MFQQNANAIGNLWFGYLNSVLMLLLKAKILNQIIYWLYKSYMLICGRPTMYNEESTKHLKSATSRESSLMFCKWHAVCLSMQHIIYNFKQIKSYKDWLMDKFILSLQFIYPSSPVPSCCPFLSPMELPYIPSRFIHFYANSYNLLSA